MGVRLTNVVGVIPSNRPRFLRHAIARVRSQGITDIVVVVNGAARDCPLPRDVVRLESPTRIRGAQAARTTAARWLRELRRHNLVAWFDDDDYYSPQHVEQMLEHWEPGAVCCRVSHYVRTKNDSLLRLEFDRETACYPQTMVLAVDDLVVDWTNRCAEHDETDWCQRMRAAGKKFVDCGPEHFAFWNGPWRHVWAPLDDEWPARCDRCYYLGNWDPLVVGGLREPTMQALVAPTFDDVDRMLRRQLTPEVNTCP